MGSLAQNLPSDSREGFSLAESEAKIEITADSSLALTVHPMAVRTSDFNPDEPSKEIHVASLVINSGDAYGGVAVTFPGQSVRVRKCAPADGQNNQQKLIVCFPNPNSGADTFDTEREGITRKFVKVLDSTATNKVIKIVSSVKWHNHLLPLQPIKKDNKLQPGKYTVRVEAVRYVR